MNNQQLRKLLKKGEIYNQYLLISAEPLLIDNTVKLIKNALNVNESFDLDSFSLPDTPIDDIMSKFYATPLASTKRLVVVKNLEELDSRNIENFERVINAAPSGNCIVITYRGEKDNMKFNVTCTKLAKVFKNAQCVIFKSDEKNIRQWIISKVKRDNLNLSPSMISYLENEFSNDVTGLKNEFEKIENYLYEAKTLNLNGIKDLAQGLCDFNKYKIVDTFLNGKKGTIALFEELRPYLRSYAEIIDALTRGLVFYTHRRKDSNALDYSSVTNFLDSISKIDRKVKKGSYFTYLMLELFFIKKAHLFRKGAIYGR
jgi:DNA polymerase III delta subunit